MTTVTGLTAQVSLLGFIVATGSESRPGTPGRVLWIGGFTKPTNMLDGDLWLKETSGTASPPEFVTTALNTITQSVAFSQALVLNGTTPMTFTISAGALPTGLTIHSTTGVISGTPSTSGAYTFTVEATNANGTATLAFSGTVSATAVAPTITTTTLTSLVQSTAFSQTLSATGTGPLAWTISGGVLPSGLTLNSSSGALTGSPTGSGAYSFTVQATNVAGSDTQAFTGTIGTAGTAPTITTTVLNTLTAGTSFTQTLSRTGSTPMTWGVSTGTIPSGLAINSSTGVLSGTPTTAGAYAFTVQATNTFGSDTQAYSGTVEAATTADIFSIFGTTGMAMTSYTDGDAGFWISQQFYQWSGAAALPAGSKIIGARLYVPADSPHIGQAWKAALYKNPTGVFDTTGQLDPSQFGSNGTEISGASLVAGWNEVLFAVEHDPQGIGGSWFIGTQIAGGTRYLIDTTISVDAIRNPEMKNFFLAETAGRSWYGNSKTSARWYGIDVMMRIPA